MNSSKALSLLQHHMPAMVREFDVRKLALFGSIASDMSAVGRATKLK